MKPACPLNDKKPRAELRINTSVFTNYFGSYINTRIIDRRNMGRKFAKLGVISLLLAFAISGCASEKRCMKYYPPEVVVKDSISYKEKVVYRDTTITVNIPGDVVHDSIKIVVPKNVVARLNTNKINKKVEFASASAWVKNNVLYLELVQNDTAINFELKDAIREASYWKEQFHAKQTIKVTPNRPAFFRGLSVGFFIGLLAVLLLLYLLSRFRSNT